MKIISKNWAHNDDYFKFVTLYNKLKASTLIPSIDGFYYRLISVFLNDYNYYEDN